MSSLPAKEIDRETNAFPDLTTKVHRTDAFPCAIGEHSDLYRARWVEAKVGERVLALKTMRTGSSSNPNFVQEFQQRFVRLGDGWVRLVHDNIAHVYGVVYGISRLPALVLNYYQGSLVSCMKARLYSQAEKMKWVQQTASGMKYLHRQTPPVVHGDLRGSNVFLDASGSCQIADIGMVYLVDSPEFASMQSARPCRWTAPELMDHRIPIQNLEGPGCTPPSDVFSFAMTLLEIFTEQQPYYHNKNDTAIIFAIVRGERPELPQSIQDNPLLCQLIRMCWDQQPSQRPTMAYVCWKLGLTSNFHYALEWANLT